MGQTPAKFFPQPTPYGTSPDMGVLAQAKQAAPAPQQSFLPLNGSGPAQQQQQPQQTQQSPLNPGFRTQLARLGMTNYRMMPGQFYE